MTSLFRPDIQRLAGYVPGEQPRDEGWIKLNTNENPYPPSPQVRGAILEASDRLHIYPDPLASEFCRRAGELFGVDEDWILAGNGSDEILTILMRSFVDSGEEIASPTPSYSLYETLADLQGSRFCRIPLRHDFQWDVAATQKAIQKNKLKLLFVPNPNSPTGTPWPTETLQILVPPQGLLVLDGAYAEFSQRPTGAELVTLDRPESERVVLTRTLSKSYGLAGLRFGFAVAHPDLIAGMRKVKDSYNCDTLSIAAACAAIDDQQWLAETTARIRATRNRLVPRLAALGFDVAPSEANFLWTRHRTRDNKAIYEDLKSRRILVRWMTFSGFPSGESAPYDGLRISIGTDEQIDRLLDVLATLL